MKIFTRSKHVTCDKTADNLLEARSGLIDTIHEIELSVILDIEKREILKASAIFLRAPYIFCSEAAEQAVNLAGLKIDQKKISAAISELVGGPQGCSQLFDLTLEAVKAINQGLKALIPGNREERMAYFDSISHGACHAHSHSMEEKKKVYMIPNIIIDRRN
ncbi:MAG: DUF2889 domain-containing protein [Bacillota bacterium]